MIQRNRETGFCPSGVIRFIKVEEGVEAAWLSEVERRMEELDAGQVQSVSWDEARARILRNLVC